MLPFLMNYNGYVSTADQLRVAEHNKKYRTESYDDDALNDRIKRLKEQLKNEYS